MKKFRTFKVHYFSSSVVRFKYFSCAYFNFSNFTRIPVHMWDKRIFHALWFFMKKCLTFKVHSFLNSDMRFKYFSCPFMIFSYKMSIFQTSLEIQFKCEIQVFFMCFHEFSWKNIELSKFIFFSIQIWDSSIFHALS
jgi:hypothetical protein